MGIARERIQKEESTDEIVQDLQFMSYLVVFGSSVDYKELAASERTTTDRLLRMGVLVEADSEAGVRKVRLSEAWRRAIEGRREKRPIS